MELRYSLLSNMLASRSGIDESVRCVVQIDSQESRLGQARYGEKERFLRRIWITASNSWCCLFWTWKGQYRSCLLLGGPVHEFVSDKHGDGPVEDLTLGSAVGVEDSGVSGTSEGTLTVLGHSVGDDTTLRWGA